MVLTPTQSRVVLKSRITLTLGLLMVLMGGASIATSHYGPRWLNVSVRMAWGALIVASFAVTGFATLRRAWGLNIVAGLLILGIAMTELLVDDLNGLERASMALIAVAAFATVLDAIRLGVRARRASRRTQAPAS